MSATTTGNPLHSDLFVGGGGGGADAMAMDWDSEEPWDAHIPQRGGGGGLAALPVRRRQVALPAGPLVRPRAALLPERLAAHEGRCRASTLPSASTAARCAGC